VIIMAVLFGIYDITQYMIFVWHGTAMHRPIVTPVQYTLETDIASFSL